MTPAQLAALKAHIQANANQIEVTAGNLQAISAVYAAGNPDHNQIIADWYNLISASNVFRTNVSVDEVQDQIVYANMTPADAVPTSPDLQIQLWKARSLACQGKQFNLQNLMIGKTKINFGKQRIRTAFQDCLTALPSAAGGANQAAGWTNVQAIMPRLGTNAEVALRVAGAGGDGTTTTPYTAVVGPYTMDFEGNVTETNIQQTRSV